MLTEHVRSLSHPLDPLPTDAEVDLRPLSGVRAILFDIYGTLLISGSGDVGTAKEQSNGDSLAEALTESGFCGDLEAAGARGAELLLSAIEEVHLRKRAEGIAFPEVEIRSLWRKVLSQLQSGGLLELGDASAEPVDRLALGYELRVNPTWPMPGVAEVLQDLRGTQLPLGIVSNAQFYTPLLLEAYLGADPVGLGFSEELSVWSYIIGESKPSTRLFSGVLNRLSQEQGIAAPEVVYVGNDMRNDVWTAARGGCRTVLFAGDRRSLRMRSDDPKCRDLKPDRVITDLRQLVTLLQS